MKVSSTHWGCYFISCCLSTILHVQQPRWSSWRSKVHSEYWQREYVGVAPTQRRNPRNRLRVVRRWLCLPNPECHHSDSNRCFTAFIVPHSSTLPKCCALLKISWLGRNGGLHEVLYCCQACSQLMAFRFSKHSHLRTTRSRFLGFLRWAPPGSTTYKARIYPAEHFFCPFL